MITSDKDIVEVLAPVKDLMETFGHNLENLHKLVLEIKASTSKSLEFESLGEESSSSEEPSK